MLGSSDLERSVAFYSGVLGLQLTARFGDFALFKTGETTLALSGELSKAEAGDKTHECVLAVSSVGATYAALKDRIEFLNEPRPLNENNWGVNFRDPDGHLLSFYGPQ
jgi:catechol 2,3-dioxygenase-like lactoylglutathione lyase family enzyme